ncbi:hypothetical protein DY000_02023524 [Brassica cretica]|uniref:Tetratricopeptide repeat protein 38 n=1 Tax=Brassica cretica TaxID=69181 RepID=A0ABQ7DYV8_BRACR|nr:hypothetical protein DY000_02023524 [Brassica cretica]
MTCEVNTSSDDCIASIKSNSHQVLGYGRDRKVILEAPLYDKDCVLGNNLAAHYLFSSDISRAKTYARAAEYHLGKATPYEKAFFEAINYLISDNMDEDVALELHSKRVEILCFYMGRPDLSLPLFEEILTENQEHDYVYGMLAFSLLERVHLAEAEKAARKGYEINKNDSWAHHCLCHVLQTECRFKEAAEFMEACSASWDSCSSLRFRITGGMSLFVTWNLEGGSPISKVQKIYDNKMCKELEKEDAVATDVYMDALGLMLRLDTRDKLPEFLDGLKVLADCLTDQKMWYQEWLFDITTIWALSKVGNTSQTHVLLEGLKSRTCNMNKKKQPLMQKAIQLAEAVYEYGKGNNTKALEMLAVRVLERRIKQRDGAPFLWHLLEKSYLMEGNAEAVVTTCESQCVGIFIFQVFLITP